MAVSRIMNESLAFQHFYTGNRKAKTRFIYYPTPPWGLPDFLFKPAVKERIKGLKMKVRLRPENKQRIRKPRA